MSGDVVAPTAELGSSPEGLSKFEVRRGKEVADPELRVLERDKVSLGKEEHWVCLTYRLPTAALRLAASGPATFSSGADRRVCTPSDLANRPLLMAGFPSDLMHSIDRRLGNVWFGGTQEKKRKVWRAN